MYTQIKIYRSRYFVQLLKKNGSMFLAVEFFLKNCRIIIIDNRYFTLLVLATAWLLQLLVLATTVALAMAILASSVNNKLKYWSKRQRQREV